jgi:hypothetical protein
LLRRSLPTNRAEANRRANKPQAFAAKPNQHWGWLGWLRVRHIAH